MKYLTLLPLAGLAVAAPGTWEDADPVKSTTTTVAKTSTWADVPADVTVTSTATGTYCPKSGKLTKAAPEGGKCVYDVTTVTVATATVTVPAGSYTGGYTGGHGDGHCDAGKVTVTETKTVGGKDTVTVTVTDKGDGSHPTGKPSGKCLTDDSAKTIVDNFRDLLEFTSYNGTQGKPGRGYHLNVSAITLAEDFVDISDSINFMAGFPLGSITFANKTAFDIGQGIKQPEVKTETLNIWHDCNQITWRWKITPQVAPPLVAYPVVGINVMQINEKGLIQKNYAEFDNGAWLQSFGRSCAVAPVTVVSGAFANKV